MGAAVEGALDRGESGVVSSELPLCVPHFSTSADLDKARAASIISAALSHLKFFGQSASFEDFFPIKFFENLFSATPVGSFWQLIWQ
jgi:hypothetical protein